MQSVVPEQETRLTVPHRTYAVHSNIAARTPNAQQRLIAIGIAPYAPPATNCGRRSELTLRVARAGSESVVQPQATAQAEPRRYGFESVNSPGRRHESCCTCSPEDPVSTGPNRR